ncbi:MAG: D-alanine--D-alanine ligase [Phycisphaerales bacterium]|nr:D-alanine--D-alanine ligase [Phycisphaerales bacterium]
MSNAPEPSNKPCRVLVLMGGPDAEREVSIMSGTEVARALRQLPEFDVVELLVDRPTAADLLQHGADVIFPVLHGPFGEGGPLQELLETLGTPYVGCAPAAASLAMDKIATKARVAAVGVRTPNSCELVIGQPISVALPLVLKPATEGSSVDLRICHTDADLAAARMAVEGKHARVLAESFIKGREVTVGIIDGEVLPIIEILPAVAFYDYQAKYIRNDTQYTIDPDLADGVRESLIRFTKLAWDATGCRDVARADFIVDERGAWFLEINTMPGMTTHSLVPKAAAHIGLGMPQLCARLLQRARHESATRFNACASKSR